MRLLVLSKNADFEKSLLAFMQKLPVSLQNELRAEVIVNEPSQVMIELVLNSLDAKATHIEVEVDPSTNSMVVKDNGHGIPSKDFQ